jgi:hypothetical protein
MGGKNMATKACAMRQSPRLKRRSLFTGVTPPLPVQRPLTPNDVVEILQERFPTGLERSVIQKLGLKDRLFDHSDGNRLYFSDSPIPGRGSFRLRISEKRDTGEFSFMDLKRKISVSFSFLLTQKEPVDIWSVARDHIEKARNEVHEQRITKNQVVVLREGVSSISRFRNDPTSSIPAA